MNEASPPSSTPRVAIYARVSSEHQAQEQTIDSQVAALRERVASDGLLLDEELCFLDDGVSGRRSARPALEKTARYGLQRRLSEAVRPFT